MSIDCGWPTVAALGLNLFSGHGLASGVSQLFGLQVIAVFCEVKGRKDGYWTFLTALSWPNLNQAPATCLSFPNELIF